MSTADDELVRGAAHGRWIAVALIVAAVVVGAPILYATRNYLDRLTALAKTDPRAAIAGFRTWVLPQLVALFAIGLLGGLWCVPEGIRVCRAARYPLAGAWMLRDTRVRRGAAERGIGVWLLIIGVGLAGVPALALGVALMLLQRYG